MAKAKKPTFDYVDQGTLQFDPLNPRFYSGSGTQLTQESIQSLLEKEPHLALQLVDSFLENGFIHYEPLVVKKDSSNYIVVEGNRRLAAIRHILSKKDSYTNRSEKIGSLEKVPVLIFPEQSGKAGEKEQRVYLGVRHLFGFRDWPAESKARFLDNQIKKDADLDRTMRELNIKKNEISRYLIPYRLRRLAKHLWEPYADQDFWVLGEGLSRVGIREYLKLDIDKDNLKILSFDKKQMRKLLEYIYGIKDGGKRMKRRINETRDLSLLSNVLRSRTATVALEKGQTVHEASIFIDTEKESLGRLKRLTNELRLLLSQVLAKQSGNTGFNDLKRRFDTFEQAVRLFLKK